MTSTKKAGIGTIIACLLGSALFVFIGISDRKFTQNCQSTQGQITEVVKRTKVKRDHKNNTTRSRKKTTYDVTYAYTVDGKEYTERDSLGSSREVGPATVYYLPSDPDNARLDKPSPILDFLIAAVFLVVGAVVGFKSLLGGGNPG